MGNLNRTHTERMVLRFLQSLMMLLLLSAFTFKLQPESLSQKVKPLSFSQARVQQIYTSQIGIREKPSNSGAAVEKYLAYVNLPKGNPWCAAFVCWVFGEAEVPNPRTGWSPGLFRANRVIWERKTESGKLKAEASVPGIKYQGIGSPHIDAYAPYNYGDPIRPAWQLATGNWQPSTRKSQPFSTHSTPLIPMTGDVFGLFFPEKRRIAHVGFIDQWDGTWLATVEGNTNDSGSREGNGVYRKRRLVRSVYKVARYVE